MLPSPIALLRAVITLPLTTARFLFSIVTTSTDEPESVVTERSRTPRGRYDEAVYAAVKNRPGLTVAQAADHVGVAASGLYPTVRRLEDEGLIERRGRELHPTA